MKRWMALAVLITLRPSFVHAQDQPAAIRELAAAVAAETQRLDEVKAELERRSAALAELTSRLDALAGAAGVPPARETRAVERAQPPLTPVPPDEPPLAASTPPRFEFYGESKVRYETLQQDYAGCVGCPNRKRGRLRLRFGAEGNLAPDFKAVVGFGIGELNDPNTVYTNLGGNFSRKVATWDRGYVEYHPQRASWIDLTAGKFPYTWLRSSMTFDVDFYPEGLSEKFSFDLPNAGPVKNVGVQGFQLIANEQPGDLHTTVMGEQFTGRVTVTDHLSTLIAATAVSISRPEQVLRALIDGSDVGVKNTNTISVRDGQSFLASGFRYANLIVENAVKTPWVSMPATVALEYHRNLHAASRLDTAKSFRVDVGRARKTGDWGLSWHVFRVEQEAIFAAWGESDWRAPSNVLQHRFEVNRMLNPNVQLGITLYRGRTLDTTLPNALLAPNLVPSLADPWMNRFYFDVTYRY
jgi:hypothetical protein